jgi:pectate lyase
MFTARAATRPTVSSEALACITKSANLVTMSYNHLHNHDKSMLIGGTDTASLTAENPGVPKTTFHHNYFQNLVQRQPRVGYGMIHLYNNYFAGSNTATLYNWGAHIGTRLETVCRKQCLRHQRRRLGQRDDQRFGHFRQYADQLCRPIRHEHCALRAVYF